MKLDFGIAQVSIPGGYDPSAIICLGKEDSGEALSAGPTLVKATVPKYRRTLAFNITKVEAQSAPDQALSQGLEGVRERARGKVMKVQDIEIGGHPAKTADIRHKFQDMRVMTFALLAFSPGYVRSVMLTVLDDAKVRKEARAEFDKVIKTFEITAK